jgi:glycosyltransferase involved in cell wall biosynthesis
VGDGLDGDALQLVERLLRRSARLHVVFAGTAGGDARARVSATAIRSWPDGMSSRVHTAPRVDWSVLARSAAVLDISTPRTAPRAALAAMAAGRAVVAFGDSPAGEVIGDGDAGWTLPGTDPERAADEILQAVGDPRRLRRLGVAARAQWSTEHAPEVRARRLAEVYALVAG